MKLHIFTLFSLLFSSTLSADEPLKCDLGPIQIELGGAMWQVTSCEDAHSLVFATMKDNPAMPFVFFVQRDGTASNISGEGNGSKEYSAAAFKELKAMTEARFDELVQRTMAVPKTQ